MWLMLQQEAPDDYVISSDETHTVGEMCEVAFDHLGLKWQDHVRIAPEFYRPAEVHLLLGSSAKAREKLGWKPEVGFEQLVRLMADADLERVRRQIKNDLA
jgi:GDPmannose 4,6-dehydratase